MLRPLVLLVFMAVVASSCSSLRGLPEPFSGNRPKSDKILDCFDLKKTVLIRDEAFSAMRGRVQLNSRDYEVLADVLLLSPSFIRAEILGPLNLRVALLTAGVDWVQLYVPREKSAFRLKSELFWRPGSRREQFLKLLPLQAPPELFPGALMTRVSPDFWDPKDPESQKNFECFFEDSLNAYRIRLKNLKGSGGRFVWIDPNSYYPLYLEYFYSDLPPLRASQTRADLKVFYGGLQGSGWASLQKEIRVFDFREKSQSPELFEMKWLQAESAVEFASGANLDSFSFSLPASTRVTEY